MSGLYSRPTSAIRWRGKLEDALETVEDIREELREDRLVGTPMWTHVNAARAALRDAVNRARYGQ